MKNHFKFIDSKYLQEKELKKSGILLFVKMNNLSYKYLLSFIGMIISPETIYWDKRVDTSFKNNESIQVMKDVTFEYISIEKTIN